jgi:hypothetical protein
MQLVFRHSIRVGKSHRIPELEMALTCKLVAMFAPNRQQTKRLVDLSDFIDMIRHNRDKLDLEKLKRLSGAVYPRGGAVVLRMVEDIDAGRDVRLEQ